MFALDRFWDTPGWPRAGLFGLAAPGLRDRPARPPPLGLAAATARSARQAPGPQAPQDRRPAPRRDRAGPRRLRAGPVPPARRGRDRAGRARLREARLPRRRADPSPPALDGPARRPRRGRGRPLRGRARPPRRTPGPGSSPPGRTRRGTPSPPSSRSRPSWWSPTASRSVFAVKLAEGDRLAPGPGRGPDRRPRRRSSRRSMDGKYEFELPSQVAKTRLEIRVGDASRVVQVEPMLRPELTSVVAGVTLPDYLGRPGSQQKDVRGGSITLVKGSSGDVLGDRRPRAGRRLGRRRRRSPDRGSTVTSPPIAVDGASRRPVPLGRPLRPGRQGAVHAQDRRPGRRGPDA